MEEKEINLYALLSECLKRWKMIVICVVVFALLFGAVGAYKAVKDDAKVKSIMHSYSDRDYFTYSAAQSAVGLTATEIAEAETAAEQYAIYQRQIESIQSYIDNNIYYKIDTERIPAIKLTYYVETNIDGLADEVAIRKSNDIVYVYKTLLTTNDVMKSIAELLGADADNDYVNNLVSVSNSDDVLVITCVAPTKEEAEKIAEFYMSYVPQVKGMIKDAKGKIDYEVHFISSDYYEQSGTNVTNSITDQNNKITTVVTNISNATKNLSTDQKKFFNAINAAKVQLSNPNVDNNSLYMHEVDYISLKWIAFGIFVGLMLPVVWICMKISNEE